VRRLASLAACALLGSAIPIAAGFRALSPLGNFACYPAAFSEFATTRIDVADQFGSRAAIVGRPTQLCAPAVVNSRPVADSFAHLTCHPIKLSLRASARMSVKTQQFGVLTATLVRAIELCVPSSVATGGALRSLPTTLDSFVCYSAVPTGTFAVRGAAISDGFAKTRDVVVRPTSLCLPATVARSGPLQSQPLACYELRSAAKGSGPVVVRSRLGLLQASLSARNELCTPATKLPS
jgi:hypothetical protein